MSYAAGVNPTPLQAMRRLAASQGIVIAIEPMDHPSFILPPIGGVTYLLINEHLHRGTRDYVIRHELAHHIAGDAEEPTLFHFSGPLPEAEDVADLFAFADLISREDCGQGVDWVREKMRERVHLDYEPWYRRLERLPAQLIRLRQRLDE